MVSVLNPSDVVTVEGTYATIPERNTLYSKEPAVIVGNEGVFEVVSVGKSVTNLKAGDWVLPNSKAFGTWRTYVVTKASKVVAIPHQGITPVVAATIFINPTTAYQMLKDFVSLKQGDWVIQNGGNSAVGRIVIQLANIWGYKTINVVRKRPDIESLRKDLTDLGATVVVTEDEIQSASFPEKLNKITGGAPVRLGLDCVGGSSADALVASLGVEGTLVIYGSLSKKPLTLGPGPFIFKDITIKGYWLSARVTKNPALKDQALKDILGLYHQGKLQLVPIQENIWKVNGTDQEALKPVQAAFEVQQKGFSNKKQVIIFK